MNFTPRKEETTNAKKGYQFESIEKYMDKNEVTLSDSMTIVDACELIIKHKLTGSPVLDKDRNIVGMLTEKDCLRLILESSYNNMPMQNKKVSEYMSKNVKTVSTENDLLDVANQFLNSHFRKYPVVHNGKLVGQVSRRDILRAAMDLKRTTW
ncbi:MAG: CBS domain-containing protein [Flammeovirgaceae bacterium]|nr:CBS domain-containing protein [Flammeovirgaceae bacterium]